MNVTRLDQVLTCAQSAHPQPLASSKTAGFHPSVAPCLRMVNSAAARIFAAWLPHIGHDAAMREAHAFAGRFHVLVDGPLAPLPDDVALDAQLEAVAAAMGAP